MTAERCLIVGAAPSAGHEAFYARLLAGYRTVVAADAAGEWCVGLGRIPELVVADFDSSSPGAADRLRSLGSRVVEIPQAKDATDLEVCLLEARGSCDRVDFCAAFEGRVDHTLAAIGTVLGAADLSATVREPTWTGHALDGATRGHLLLEMAPGTLFSLVAPSGARGVSIIGAAYPLAEAVLGPLSGLGVSNVAERASVEVSVTEGRVLVIVQHAQGNEPSVSNN